MLHDKKETFLCHLDEYHEVLVVLKVPKGLVNVCHGYSKVEFWHPVSTGSMTLPRGESWNGTIPHLARHTNYGLAWCPVSRLSPDFLPLWFHFQRPWTCRAAAEARAAASSPPPAAVVTFLLLLLLQSGRITRKQKHCSDDKNLILQPMQVFVYLFAWIK